MALPAPPEFRQIPAIILLQGQLVTGIHAIADEAGKDLGAFLGAQELDEGNALGIKRGDALRRRIFGQLIF